MYDSLLNGGQIAKVVTLLPEPGQIMRYPLGGGRVARGPFCHIVP